MRRAWPLLLLAACSSTPEDRLKDGGGFSIPDGGQLDATIRDSGAPDVGPWVCDPPCTSPEVCGCVGVPTETCGCHRPAGYATLCDPLHPETCAAPLECVPSRVQGDRVALCSDGREASYCSHLYEICSTAHGCVCLTSPTGLTECTCMETIAPDTMLCDRMVPASCPNGTCVRVDRGGVVWFFCSHGAEGDPCELGDNSCNTSLGCTCPRIGGREVCRCSVPGDTEGDPCDPNVAGACVAPLECRVNPDQINGTSTICTTFLGQPDGGIGGECDPGDPTSCPGGFNCVPVGGGRFECRPV
jgi:hypothetical protein